MASDKYLSGFNQVSSFVRRLLAFGSFAGEMSTPAGLPRWGPRDTCAPSKERMLTIVLSGGPIPTLGRDPRSRGPPARVKPDFCKIGRRPDKEERIEWRVYYLVQTQNHLGESNAKSHHALARF